MPRSVDSAARIDALAAAVADIAAESGFTAVTIRAVAHRIGASTSAVTHYASSRDDLLRGTVSREIDRRTAAAEHAIGSATGRAGLRALLEWAVLAPGERGHRLWLALVLAAPVEPVLRAELDRFNTWWDARVREFLADEGGAGAADLIAVVVDGLVITGFDDGTPWSIGRRTAVLDALWRELGWGGPVTPAR